MTERATRAWLPPILARRISTRSRRLLAASPVLFREVAAFFFAKSPCSDEATAARPLVTVPIERRS